MSFTLKYILSTFRSPRVSISNILPELSLNFSDSSNINTLGTSSILLSSIIVIGLTLLLLLLVLVLSSINCNSVINFA